ncbi:solute carrier family 40 (iron-regulated transporter), member 1 [Fistulifera solaris]|uniref:Solute carrier family 40 member n=1 Tax=Fistulifera solaris TaxID=1519565 RepID=A0A1Z5JPL5_FISSO|nr:solute carrier family 40 (iron-regulated transporter), member 1 [Fistulifera solaris]|eukprot:GAX15983.1 solute carrier family 40 (iron-regulated transporter), member 1 [Fistulifera solaris]
MIGEQRSFQSGLSLILVSSYGIALNLSVCVTAASLGDWIDRTDRLQVARRLIVFENLAVFVGTLSCWFLLSSISSENESSASPNMDESSMVSSQQRFSEVPRSLQAIVSLLGIHVFGSLAQLLDRAFLVAIERDWVVVLSQAAGEEHFQRFLSDTNVTMKQIDLSCKVVAPGIAGLLISMIGNLKWACLVVGGINLAALFVEYSCTTKVYALIPALSFPKHDLEPQHETDESCVVEENTGSPSLTNITCPLWLPYNLRIYLEQPSSPGGIGLAFLYANALTFGNGIMTSYLLYRGMPMDVVGILRGIASAIGLLGTVVYSYSVVFLSLEATACWSVTFQCACLAVALVSVSLVSSDKSAEAMLVSSVSLSRIGLWVFDIAVTQMQQQEIPEHIRGLVGGVQHAMNAFFTILSFALGFVFPDPRQFQYFVLCGFTSVFFAAVLFTFGMYIPRRGLH